MTTDMFRCVCRNRNPFLSLFMTCH